VHCMSYRYGPASPLLLQRCAWRELVTNGVCCEQEAKALEEKGREKS
jgi:hypothetical protein